MSYGIWTRNYGSDEEAFFLLDYRYFYTYFCRENRLFCSLCLIGTRVIVTAGKKFIARGFTVGNVLYLSVGGYLPN